MTVVAAVIAGLLASLVLQRGTQAIFALPVLDRENYRGHHLPTAAGLVLAAAVIAVEGARTLGGVVRISDAATAPARLAILLGVVAFAFLGLLDDLLGDGADRGLSGHIRAVLHGRITTGFIKLGGGAAVSLMLAGAHVGDRPLRVLIDGALIALAANMGNLFDRAPGRTTKVAFLAWIPVAVVAGTSATGIAVAVVMGAALGLLPADLAERSMLGDTGANVLGATLGIAVVLSTGDLVRDLTVGILFALTLLSEKVSFSKVIRRFGPFHLLDRLGRRPEASTP